MKQRIRKQINRSGTHECSICHKSHILVIHHIRGRDIENPNHESNLVNLCDNCHRLTHENKIVIEGYFQTTNGIELLWHKKENPSFSGQNIQPYIIP